MKTKTKINNINNDFNPGDLLIAFRYAIWDDDDTVSLYPHYLSQGYSSKQKTIHVPFGTILVLIDNLQFVVKEIVVLYNEKMWYINRSNVKKYG